MELITRGPSSDEGEISEPMDVGAQTTSDRLVAGLEP